MLHAVPGQQFPVVAKQELVLPAHVIDETAPHGLMR